MGSTATTQNEGLLGADFVSHNLALHQNGGSQLPPSFPCLRSCSRTRRLSLKSQELTAMFTSVRVYCSFDLGYHRHTILHLTTLVVPCAVLSLFIHPTLIRGHSINSILWAFCIYLESVSVLPQLRLMQKAKIVEPFAAHYVFALGVERFLSSAIWILEVINSYGRLLTGFSNGISWPVVVILCEIVQTFILVDFCYYYLKR
ncbi:unnamed protein product [Lupinus luteus]|uniref:ER lumen protein retaining receptor n=1 Tax=Lupinus luteus TaxID=3873 RepID=A0AAV1XLL5_LUPLU